MGSIHPRRFAIQSNVKSVLKDMHQLYLSHLLDFTGRNGFTFNDYVYHLTLIKFNRLYTLLSCIFLRILHNDTLLNSRATDTLLCKLTVPTCTLNRLPTHPTEHS